MSELEALLSADARNFRPSAIRALSKLINDPSIISFAGGVPNPETFPAEDLLICAEKVLREKRSVSLQYGPTLGLFRLRESVAAICRDRSIDAGGEQVLITTGSQQALNLVAQTMLDPGDVVLVELPTYIGGASSFHARRADLIGVEQDDAGIDPASLRKVAEDLVSSGRRVKFLYTIPNFQNPSGRLMVAERREAVLAIATEFDFLILEDDPYGELVYIEGLDTTPIKALDRSGRVIYLGSFSKVLAPGLRCGWILADSAMLRQFELAKEAADLCSGMLDQSIVDEFCAAGKLNAQIARVREFYRDRRGAMIAELALSFAGIAHWTDATGGLFTFVTMHEAVDTAALIEGAVGMGVAYVPGSAFFVDGSGANTMRLTFAKEGDERMREGLARLKRFFENLEHG